MAKSISPFTWERGFREPSSGMPWQWEPASDAENDAYITPPSKELLTSTAHNSLGINVLRTWPTIFDGTNNPHGMPQWWNPESEVDVLIVGGEAPLFQSLYILLIVVSISAGPSGLETALSLARQGVSFRIIGK